MKELTRGNLKKIHGGAQGQITEVNPSGTGAQVRLPSRASDKAKAKMCALNKAVCGGGPGIEDDAFNTFFA